MKETASNSTLFCTLLTVLFIGLKLTGYINWAWYWVLGPLWIPLALGIIIVIGIIGIFLFFRIGNN